MARADEVLRLAPSWGYGAAEVTPPRGTVPAEPWGPCERLGGCQGRAEGVGAGPFRVAVRLPLGRSAPGLPVYCHVSPC
jgi:hypothetical protein